MTDEDKTANSNDRQTQDAGDDQPSHVVAIGASAGGLEALDKFFHAMPADTGMAFVVIQHLSPDFRSLMDELLERVNTMPVIQVKDDMDVRPNHVYLLSPGCELTISGQRLHSRVRVKDGQLFLPINVFFRSLAGAWSERAVAIVLSGTGSDGTHGVLDIRDNGGVVLVESLESASFTGMPQSVIDTGCADAILAPEEMPRVLMSYATNPETARQLRALNETDPKAGGIAGVLLLLRDAYRIDFNHYKPSTIVRRIERRMTLNSLNLSEYLAHLQSDPVALDLLYKDLLIGVTRFFRDAEAFAALREKVVPRVLELVPPEDEIRIWVCGCATGEEAYSIAIVFLEALTAAGRPPQLKVLATDLHSESLQTAGLGVYSEQSLQEMPAELRARYFEPLDGAMFKVVPALRKALIFSQHNLLNDPPFTKIHLVSCRNLLIYLQTPAQSRALASFHYALAIGGVMFLGPSETLGNLNAEFETLDRPWKLYRKTGESRSIASLRMPGTEQLRTTPNVSQPNLPMLRVYDALMEVFVPSGLLLDAEQHLLHVFGDARRFIRTDSGRVTNEVSSLIARDLQLPLVSALRNAVKQRIKVSLPNVKVTHEDGTEERLQLTVIPVSPKANAPVYMVTLEPESRPPIVELAKAMHAFEVGDDVKDYIGDIESELQRTRESLQATVEELETSNEELQASNEELLASNEELQSTNEELHSVNEELYSVNAEHEAKIEELNQMGSDLRNLIHSTDTATIFVDGQFQVRMFTPKAKEVIYLLTQDVGRDIRHIKTIVPDPQLTGDIASVLDNSLPMGRYLAADGDRSFMRNCTAYQDVLGHSQGVVINYVETTQLIRTNRALEESDARFELILQTTPNAIFVLDDKSEIAVANRHGEQLFGTEGNALLGMAISRLIPDPALLELLHSVHAPAAGRDWRPPEASPFEGRRLDGTSLPVEVTCAPLTLDDKPYVVTLISDISLRAANQKATAEALAAAQALAGARSQFVANMSHEIRTPLNGILGLAEIGLTEAGERRDELPGRHFAMIQDCGRHLLEVINEVLDYAKIDAGTHQVELQAVDLHTLIHEAMASLDFMLRDRPLAMHFESADDAARHIVTDPVRLRQALINLLSNAIKFTERGRVEVVLATSGEHVVIEVRDTGIGIGADDLKRVMMPFEQVDPSATRRYGGTGLGLAITQRMVELLDGTLTVTSTPGVGSTFTIRLPSRDAGKQHEGAPTDPVAASGSTAPAQVDRIRVLAAEDDPTSQVVMCAMLDALGAQAQMFDNGALLVDHVRANGTAEVDVVLMDIQMPVMNGYDASRILREIDPELPIVAVTAHAFSEEVEKMTAAGMDGHLSKPYSLEGLSLGLRQHARPVENEARRARDESDKTDP